MNVDNKIQPLPDVDKRIPKPKIAKLRRLYQQRHEAAAVLKEIEEGWFNDLHSTSALDKADGDYMEVDAQIRALERGLN